MSVHVVVALRDLSFSHDLASAPLFTNLSLHLPRGYTGIVGANGAGKSTLLRLVAGELTPTAGVVEQGGRALYCEQRTDAPPAGLADFLDDWAADAFELRGRLGIEPDCLTRWSTLSHGERKRAQIGWALWQNPDVLAIDEPTNHIDTHARTLLSDALRRFRGVGLLVSHDRTLLDELCLQCLWIDPPRARLYQGGYSAAVEQRRIEREGAVARREQAARELAQIEKAMNARRQQAGNEHRNRSKRGLHRKDSDAREKIDRARLTDGQAGAALRQLQGRSQQARERLEAAPVEKLRETGIWLSAERSRRDTLFRLEAGEVPLGGDRMLRFPRLSMAPTDRIAITGDNGSGKSTLLRLITQHLNVPAPQVISMPQEIAAADGSRLLAEVRALPSERLGQVMNIVSRLGSRPQQLIESHSPSPGEVRKLLLALGMVRTPHLIVLDEPTNHLDLPSIEALEDALADCPCGLLLVSHDRPFLERLSRRLWRVEPDRLSDSRVRVD